MPYPRVFISSTYIDLLNVRETVENCLHELLFEPIAFERGGISYDHKKPMDLSCYEAVKECDMMILIIGGRYGSLVSNKVDSTDGETINSITKTEYLEALSVGIKVITFIKEDVLAEYYTYRNQTKKARKEFKPAKVDNTAIFDLIYEIKELKRNNEIVAYHSVSDITNKLKQEVALLAQRGLKENQAEDHETDVMVNAYKMFYYRRQKRYSLTALAKKTRLKRNLISSLEKEKSVDKLGNPDSLPFRTCNKEILKKIEKALDCDGQLSAGLDDDMLSQYVNYYHCNRGKQPSKNRSENENLELFPKKAVVLDFDGTMTTQKSRTTWEMIWTELGYSTNDCNFYHRQFSNGLISHEKWCQITSDKFKERGITENTLTQVASTIELVDGVLELVEILEKNDIEFHILSGSIEQIIRMVLGQELFNRFTHVQANSLKFTNAKLTYIEGTKYDFEGKADYINNLIRSRKYSRTDVLFVGNSSNDRWASRSGVTTLCVNPHFTDGNDEKEWIYCLREMDNILEILKYIKLEMH